MIIQTQFAEITQSVDLADALWNSSRQENTIINTMLQARERTKAKLQPCITLYKEMKKNNVPLSKEQRDRVLYS